MYRLHDVNDLLVEGGSATATAFLAEDLVDRILIYRAPIIVGEGKSSLGYVGLDAIADAHGRWRPADERRLGVDRLEVYERVRDAKRGPCSPGSSPTSAPSSAPSRRGDLRLTIGCGYDLSTVDLGASIACSGICLTVVDKGETGLRSTSRRRPCRRTAADLWREGAKLNLERSLRVGDELGGHFVTGHVDCLGKVVRGSSRRRFGPHCHRSPVGLCGADR